MEQGKVSGTEGTRPVICCELLGTKQNMNSDIDILMLFLAFYFVMLIKFFYLKFCVCV